MSEEPFLIDGKLLLTVDEAAAYLNIGRSQAYVLVLSGDIRSIKIGRSRRVPAYALSEFVAGRLDEAAP